MLANFVLQYNRFFMNHFGRVVRLSLVHRWTILLSVLCALGVAVLWGGNITAVYPLVEVVLDGKSSGEWLSGEIEERQETILRLEEKILLANEAITTSASATEKAEKQSSLAKYRERVAAEQLSLKWYQTALPYAEKYAPQGAFSTLLWICVLLLVGTILKSLFRVIGQVLVARVGYLTIYDLRKEFYRHTLRMDLASLDEQSRGDIIARFTTDLGMISAGLQTLFCQAVREPLKAVACLVGAAYVSWRLLLLTLFVAPIAGYLINRLAQSLKRANRRAMVELAASTIYSARR